MQLYMEETGIWSLALPRVTPEPSAENKVCLPNHEK